MQHIIFFKRPAQLYFCDSLMLWLLVQIKAEVTYQAQRLGHHASLAVWGGNNEVETAFAWFPESRTNPNLFSVDFSVLFVETIREAILSVDKSIAFVDSSPSNGVYSTDPYVKRYGLHHRLLYIYPNYFVLLRRLKNCRLPASLLSHGCHNLFRMS